MATLDEFRTGDRVTVCIPGSPAWDGMIVGERKEWRDRHNDLFKIVGACVLVEKYADRTRTWFHESYVSHRTRLRAGGPMAREEHYEKLIALVGESGRVIVNAPEAVPNALKMTVEQWARDLIEAELRPLKDHVRETPLP